MKPDSAINVNSKRLPTLSRLFARMLGRDTRLLEQCPDDEKASISLEGIAVCYAALYVSVGSAAALVTVTTPLVAILAGCVLGVGVGLFDAANSARKHQALISGLANSKNRSVLRNGFGLGLIPRLVLAVGAAFFVSTFLLQIPFGADIAAYQEKQEQLINAPLYEKYESAITLEKQILQNRINESKSNRNQLRFDLENLLIRSDALTKEIEHWRTIASCESTGRDADEVCPGVTGIKGEEDAWRFAEEKQIRLTENLSQLNTEIDQAKSRLTTAENQIPSLSDLSPNQAAKLNRLVREDNQYKQVPKSLLYSIENLWELSQDKPVILALVIAVEAVLVSLDLLGLMITAWRKPRLLEHQKAYQLMKMESKLKIARGNIWLKELEFTDKIDLAEERLEMRKHVRAKLVAAKLNSHQDTSEGSLH